MRSEQCIKITSQKQYYLLSAVYMFVDVYSFFSSFIQSFFSHFVAHIFYNRIRSHVIFDSIHTFSQSLVFDVDLSLSFRLLVYRCDCMRCGDLRMYVGFYFLLHVRSYDLLVCKSNKWLSHA